MYVMQMEVGVDDATDVQMMYAMQMKSMIEVDVYDVYDVDDVDVDDD